MKVEDHPTAKWRETNRVRVSLTNSMNDEIVSEDHLYWTRRGWVAAVDLVEGDEVGDFEEGVHEGLEASEFGACEGVQQEIEPTLSRKESRGDSEETQGMERRTPRPNKRDVEEGVFEEQEKERRLQQGIREVTSWMESIPLCEETSHQETGYSNLGQPGENRGILQKSKRIGVNGRSHRSTEKSNRLRIALGGESTIVVFV
jgi:hypothetical protein